MRPPAIPWAGHSIRTLDSLFTRKHFRKSIIDTIGWTIKVKNNSNSLHIAIAFKPIKRFICRCLTQCITHSNSIAQKHSPHLSHPTNGPRKLLLAPFRRRSIFAKTRTVANAITEDTNSLFLRTLFDILKKPIFKI